MDGALERAVGEFAESLKRAPEWAEWERAQAEFDADRELSLLIDRLQELSTRLRRQRAAGGTATTDFAELQEFARLQEALKTHAVFLRHQQSNQRLVQLFQQTNERVSEKLGVDFASTAAPRGGGCCG